MVVIRVDHKCSVRKQIFVTTKKFRVITESGMVSTPEELTDNIPMKVAANSTRENPSARKSLHQFHEMLGVKQKTSVHRLGFANEKHKAIKRGKEFCSNICKHKGY